MKTLRLTNFAWLILLLLIALNSKIFANDEYNFRQTKWGMSKEEVIKNESSEPDKVFTKGDTLAYHSDIFGEKVLILYKFSFNKLVWAKYILYRYLFEKEKVIAPAPIVDFDIFDKKLINKYGKPEKKGVKISKENQKRYKQLEKGGNDKDIIEFMDKAIRDGNAEWYSAWKIKDTLILLHLHGNKGKINFEISYGSLKFKGLNDEDLL
jgi:hypothetical protein